MKQNPFSITAKAESGIAQIRLIGRIGWENNSETFRNQIDRIINEGIRDAHIYINSVGGSTIDAAEIVNIISAFPGKITGEGGAIVASAATYIAINCSEFVMPENGLYMVHRPKGLVEGNSSEIESYLKLIKDVESQYFNSYNQKTTNKKELKRLWEKADWWMTAQEAKDNGFISSVRNLTAIDDRTTALISACGCPKNKLPNINTNKMSLKLTASTLGLPEDSQEQEIVKAISDIKAASERNAKEAQRLQKQLEDFEKKEKDQIKAEGETQIQDAIKDGRINADGAEAYRKFFETDPVSAKKSLESIPVRASVSAAIESNQKTNNSELLALEAKSWDELDKSEKLSDLKKNYPEMYAQKYKQKFGKDPE